MLVLPTQVRREKIVQDARIILPPYGQKVHRTGPSPEQKWFAPIPGPDEYDGNWPNCIRHVQLLVPGNPRVYIAADMLPEKIGPDRVYKLPPMPAGTTIKFKLLPHQWLIAAVDEGNAATTLIIEYLHPNAVGGS